MTDRIEGFTIAGTHIEMDTTVVSGFGGLCKETAGRKREELYELEISG